MHGCSEDDTLFLSELLYSSEQQSIYEIPVLITGEELVGSEFFDCRPGVGSAGTVFSYENISKVLLLVMIFTSEV